MPFISGRFKKLHGGIIGGIFTSGFKNTGIDEIREDRIKIELIFMPAFYIAEYILHFQIIVKILQEEITSQERAVLIFDNKLIREERNFNSRCRFFIHLIDLILSPCKDLITGHIHFFTELINSAERFNIFLFDNVTISVGTKDIEAFNTAVIKYTNVHIKNLRNNYIIESPPPHIKVHIF